MKKTVQDLTILDNICLNKDTNLLIFKVPGINDELQPGQFANVLVKDSPTTFLRRPFSFYDYDAENETLSLLIKKVGDGTHKLGTFTPGDQLSIIYPLGKGFTMPEKGEKVLLIGGGSGIAPMMILAKKLAKITSDVHILLGARSKEDHVELEKFKSVGNLHLTTEDGSMGEKGYVTAHSLFKQLSAFDRIYTCGPDPMMKAIGDSAAKEGVFCEASLENMMGCGFGVCLCCVTPTHENGNLCVCTDGPVFNTKDLAW